MVPTQLLLLDERVTIHPAGTGEFQQMIVPAVTRLRTAGEDRQRPGTLYLELPGRRPEEQSARAARGHLTWHRRLPQLR
ncbi:hypothetical protein PUR61_18505 [Streptomyces sp. BE20]|uniref:hypothetical protein n=1 Tax=unclassified Streptomyces TaxID=2593676 RepID=UPI002E778B6B|nr:MULTISPECIES: hypothetical protein [unclassified Streptomyces]MED7947495.1 hypothetical protein [Streptomyces sp. BE303]MEE1824162.1 hypothetical protein [Streptomyces sp. BE20]